MPSPQLKREIGLLQATSINMIDMVGIGPFVMLSLVIQIVGSHLFLWAWIFGALTALVDGMIWSELGAAYPLAGGSYNFLKAAYGKKWGPLMSFLFVWQTCLQAPLVIASQARVALGMQRALDNFDYRQQHGTIPPTSTITTREALGWITVEGARMLQQQDRIGSLAAGKQADLVVIRATDLNMQPAHDPVSTVVMQTSLANVDSVMVAGQWKKRDGKLVGVTGLDRDLQALRESGEKITKAMGL